MTMTLFNAWGKKIATYEGRTVMGLFSFSNLHSSWETAIFTASNGRTCEVFLR